MDFKKYLSKLDKYDYLAIIIVILAFAVRFAFYEHCLWVDEARDLEVTRNFFSTGKQILFDEVYLVHPILNYIILATSSLFFGFTTLGGTMPSILLGALTVAVVYFIGSEVFNKKVGIAASLIMLFHPLHWFYSSRALNNVPNTFFFVFAIYTFILFIKTKNNKYLYLTGLITACAILTRFASAILLIIMVIYLFLDKQTYNQLFSKFLPKKNTLIFLGILLGLGAISLMYNQISYGQMFDTAIYLDVGLSKSTLDAQPWWYYFATFHVWIRLSITILFILGVIIVFPKMDKLKFLLLLTIILTFIEISIVSVKTDRYILPILPFIALFAGYFLVALWGTIKKHKITIAYIVLIVILGAIVVPFYYEGSNMITNIGKGFCGLDKAGQWVIQNTSPEDNIFSASYMSIGFYSNRDNIRPIPNTRQELVSLIDSGGVNYIFLDGIERTQPEYLFEFLYNNSDFEVVGAVMDAQDTTRPILIMYKYNTEPTDDQNES